MVSPRPRKSARRAARVRKDLLAGRPDIFRLPIPNPEISSSSVRVGGLKPVFVLDALDQRRRHLVILRIYLLVPSRSLPIGNATYAAHPPLPMRIGGLDFPHGKVPVSFILA